MYMTESKTPGDEAIPTAESAAAAAPAPTEPAAAAAPAPTEPAAAAAPAPTEPAAPAGGATEAVPAATELRSSPASGDGDRESVEVEPVVVEPTKGAASRAAHHHHPPPPPSIRTKGGAGSRDKLGVAGDPKLAQDLMTRKIFTIGQEDILAHLEEHMQAFRFRHLPVVEDRKLVGLITHADLLHASSSFLSTDAKVHDEIIHKLPAKRIMQRELVTVRPTHTLAEVAVVMWEAKAGCVLVTEEDGTLVGIITEGDFIRLAHHFLVQAESAPPGAS
jgi:CBS domain-containing membrane protein